MLTACARFAGRAPLLGLVNLLPQLPSLAPFCLLSGALDREPRKRRDEGEAV